LKVGVDGISQGPSDGEVHVTDLLEVSDKKTFRVLPEQFEDISETLSVDSLNTPSENV
jgi:hypothetical protein